MNSIKLIPILLFCIVNYGCATDPKDKGVKIGMDQAQVLAIMGEPTQKKKNGYCVEGKACTESWVYYGRHVTFNNGVVAGF